MMDVVSTPGNHRRDHDLPTVSVVMPTHNRRHLLQRVLDPLLRDPDATEIIVVADGCTDGTVALLDRMAEQDPRVTPLSADGAGASGARQHGLAHARGDVVLFLDDDVLAEPGLVRGHQLRHAAGEALVVLGYMPVDLQGPRKPGEFATYLYAQEYERRVGRYERDPDVILHRLWAGNMSLRRRDALAVGMASPQTASMYHEDRDFGLRCLKAGLTGAFERGLTSHHLHERTLQAFIRDAKRQGADHARLAGAHGDVIGSASLAQLYGNLPTVARPIAWLGSRPVVRPAVEMLLTWAITATGRMRWYTAETALARLGRRVWHAHGFSDAKTST